MDKLFPSSSGGQANQTNKHEMSLRDYDDPNSQF